MGNEHEPKMIGLPVRTRLILLRIRLSSRLFCWLARHWPWLAEAWALDWKLGPRRGR